MTTTLTAAVALFTIAAVVVLPTTALAQAEEPEELDTKTGFVEPGVDNAHIYTFFSLFGGPTSGTLVWDNTNANLALILVCGTAEPLTFAISAGGVDRVSRFETGVPPLTTCIVSVASLDQAASYWLNIRDSVDSSIERMEDDTQAALSSSQSRALAVIQETMRAIERQPR